MVDLVLHPGHSKCGSTTIQNFLFKNRNIFMRRGVILPDLHFRFPNQKDFNADLVHTPRDYFAKFQSGEIGIADIEARLDSFLDRASELGHRRVIISAENLINGLGQQDSKSEQLLRLFNAKFNSVRVVYYIRRQDKFLLSAWQQWGHKEGLSLNEYAEKMIKTKIINFFFVSNKLSSIFGRKNVKVRPIERSCLKDNDLLADFCMRSAINKESLDFDVENSNVGLNPSVCELLTPLHKVYNDVHDQAIKEKLTNIVSFSEPLLYKKTPVNFSESVVSLLVGQVHENNIELHKRYFPKVDFDNTMNLQVVYSKKKSEIDILKERIDKLQDIASLQLDMIMNLANKINEKK